MKLSILLAPLTLAASVAQSPIDKLPVDEIKCFYQQVFKCLPVQESPICTEGDEIFNPVGCAIKLNICLRETMQGIGQCVQDIQEPEAYADGTEHQPPICNNSSLPFKFTLWCNQNGTECFRRKSTSSKTSF